MKNNARFTPPPLIKSGFSLVELSIVLVILGLLVGGVLSGQSLIRAAELRSISTDLNRYVAATQTFRDKYFALPGDMNNATSFWGAAHATPATCAGTASTGTATCNGNGDGRVTDTQSSISNEIYRYWQQLANAGLVEGTYSGVTGPGHAHYESLPSINVPRGKISNTGYTIYHYVPVLVADPIFFEGNYENSIVIGTQGAGQITQGMFLKAEELWKIDTKMDDGSPGLGKILTYESHIACHTETPSITLPTAATARYELDNSSIGCAMIHRQAF